MQLELEEIKQFMQSALEAHSDESRQSMLKMSTVIEAAVERANSSEKNVEDMQNTLQTMREEGIARTVMITTNLDNITATVRETNTDVKTLTIETAIQGARIKALEGKSGVTPNAIKSAFGQYSTSIISTVLLIFVVGMFSVGKIDVVDSVTKLFIQ